MNPTQQQIQAAIDLLAKISSMMAADQGRGQSSDPRLFKTNNDWKVGDKMKDAIDKSIIVLMCLKSNFAPSNNNSSSSTSTSTNSEKPPIG
jgi:hypothetical protein